MLEGPPHATNLFGSIAVGAARITTI